MKRILVFSWFYPPINSSEAVLCWKLLKNSRFSFDVFTQKRSDSWSYGRDDTLSEAENVRCIYAGSGDLRAWTEEAWRYAAAHHEEYALIMTRSMPPECHLIGLRVKRRWPEIPWMASFGDPILNNPYELLCGGLYSPYSMKNPINRDRALRFRLSPRRLCADLLWNARHLTAARRRHLLARAERGCIALADRLIFNNRSQLDYMLGNGSARAKAVLVRHSYDESLYPTCAACGPDEKLRFVFTGRLDGLRSARPLLEAICRLKEDRPELPSRAAFEFYGEMPDAELAFILRNGLDDTVCVNAPVPYLQSLSLMRGADWLVQIDADIGAVCDENVFFAGKLADYFGSGRPILAVGMQRGDAADCLRRAGALTLSYSVNEIRQALYQIVFERRSYPLDEAYIRGFSARRAAAVFDEKAVRDLL